MSHVQDLYREEALGIISSREFDRRFDDAVEQDLIDRRAERDLDAEYEAYCSQAYEEYVQDMLNSMTPHERKHSLNPRRMDLKGGHRQDFELLFSVELVHFVESEHFTPPFYTLFKSIMYSVASESSFTVKRVG